MKHKTHIVGLSGGKDSSALALRLKELNPNTRYLYVCTPTGDELPEMEQHWQNLESILNQPIIRLHHPDYKTIYELIDEMCALPNFRQRWCTGILKLEAIKHFYDQVKPAVVYIGLRADECKREGFKLLDDDIKTNVNRWNYFQLMKIYSIMEHIKNVEYVHCKELKMHPDIIKPNRRNKKQ